MTDPFSVWQADVQAAEEAKRQSADMRAVVTPAMHAVLDLLEQRRAGWAELDAEDQAQTVILFLFADPLPLTEAAARLIDALEKMGESDG